MHQLFAGTGLMFDMYMYEENLSDFDMNLDRNLENIYTNIPTRNNL